MVRALLPQPHCSMMSCLGVPVIRLWDSQPCPPSSSLSPQVHLQPVWVMGAQQATHHANILPWLLLLGLGQSPIRVLSVERGFHSNIRWKHTIESTQVWMPGMCKLSASLQALVCPPLSPSLCARFSHNSFAQSCQSTPRPAFAPFFISPALPSTLPRREALLL